MAKLGPRYRYPVYRDDIERWCKEGKTDAWIAQQIGEEGITAVGIQAFRVRSKIYGPNSKFPKHPLDEWFDGNEHTIVRGKDFDPPAAAMAKYLYTAAKRRQGLVAARVEGKKITFKFDSFESLGINRREV